MIDFGGSVMMHCHVLNHEDNGSMGWMDVTGGPVQSSTDREQITCPGGAPREPASDPTVSPSESPVTSSPSKSPSLSPITSSPTTSDPTVSVATISPPSLSPVTSNPTIDPTTIEELACLRVITGGITGDGGYVDVYVDKNDGNGYVEVSQSNEKYGRNSIVIEDCYTNLIDVQVMNTNTNAWKGSVETSVDGGATYYPMSCGDLCTPLGVLTTNILVDGNANTGGNVRCVNSNRCTLANMATPEPAPKTTSSPSQSPVTSCVNVGQPCTANSVCCSRSCSNGPPNSKE